MKEEKKENYLALAIILLSVIVFGVFLLTIFQKYSVNNKYICAYLGGLWEKKDSDPVHRCYTYEEFYDYDQER
jgi:hypothetical protein